MGRPRQAVENCAGAAAFANLQSCQAEASMVLTGKISINADGSVAGYEIDQKDKVPGYVLSSLAKWVPDWRFEPVLVDGKAVPAVEDALVERINLSVYASKWQMSRFRDRLGAAAVKAARGWTFIPPSTGELAQDSSWSVRVPVDFTLGRKAEVAYGEWTAYLPGPYQPAPWLESDESGSDALADGAMHTMGSGPVLMSPAQG